MNDNTHPIFAQLACLKRQHDALEPCQHIAARALKEQAITLVEAWFEGENGMEIWPKDAIVTPPEPTMDTAIYDRLLELTSEYDKLKGRGDSRSVIAAGLVRMQAHIELDEFIEQQSARNLADTEELEKVASARQHVSETLQAWTREQEEGAPF
jgi:hypothetical protein